MEYCKISAVALVLFAFSVCSYVHGFDSSIIRNDELSSNVLPNYYFQEAEIRSKRSPISKLRKRLIDEDDCRDEIKKLCGTLSPTSDDLSVLECIQSFKANQLSSIDPKCQNVIWRHIADLIDDNNLRELAQHSCASDMSHFQCPESNGHTGNLLACMLDKREDIKTVQCRAFIQRLEWVAFTDFRLISPFADACKNDIDRYKCGRLQGDEHFSQGRTLVCLQKQVNRLEQNCLTRVLHLSELQADDVKLDHQLYLACADDHLRFCPEIAPGSGKCQEHLTRRQRLIAQDYKVSRGLSRACKEDIKTFHCRHSVSPEKSLRLAQILLCLEAVIRNGSKVSRDCQIEMMEHRKILMEDYRLSPEIVSDCLDDIQTYCNGLEVGGKTIHCLMEHIRSRKRKERVSPVCQRALESLVKEADVGEDWRVDPVLREACKSVVDVACSEVRGGDARVMSCLMDKLGTDHMTTACETALLQIQYFIARDFKLDPQLYRQCREDAIRFCHAKNTWSDDATRYDPERGPLVLPCLYRYADHPEKNMRLRMGCLEEIKRVMRQRAVSVDLQPEVEDACLEDLSNLCGGKTGKGEEMVCLQDKLEKLSQQCRTVVSNFTEEEAEHVELNPVIMSVCQGIMERHCEAELKMGKDEGDIMECLIDHKNEPDMRAEYKCRAAVEHFQLISLKSYHFTYKFKEACRTHVLRYCPNSRTKSDVIYCLSEQVRNDTLRETKHTISKECRQQLRAQLFQQRENIAFDTRLQNACKNDIQNVLECLQRNKPKLTFDCHRAVFNVEKQELMDSSIDYTLMTTCRHMIRQFCHEEDQSQALVCLKRYKDETTFDPKCKMIVVRRMIEQSQDYRFNPMLQKGCHPDISKFCSEVIAKGPQDVELEGKVVKCLKTKFRERKLRKECEQQVATILREAALNYQLNPLLATLCKNEIEIMCKPDDESEDGSGAVEECLKNAFNTHRSMSDLCKLEIASMIEEAKADIHVDPLLHQACGIDVSKFCRDIPQGAGRRK
ncbi:Golgi apparatus protein 1 [Blattella germanica]|nr:Golgi apparatus protein 1 [Blattella germanica]